MWILLWSVLGKRMSDIDLSLTSRTHWSQALDFLLPSFWVWLTDKLMICSDRLDPNYFCVHVFWAAFFSSFFFFFGSAAIVDFVNCEQCIRALFTVPQITLFSHFFIKNRSHSTIYTFKNYFATVFSVSVFNFSKNKLNPNTPYGINVLVPLFPCLVYLFFEQGINVLSLIST